MKYTISVITRLQDNGDGGYTMRCYNTEEEMLTDHYEVRNASPEKLEKVKEEILTEYDPYNNGYLGSDTIEIEIDENGVAKLAAPLSFHAGQ